MRATLGRSIAVMAIATSSMLAPAIAGASAHGAHTGSDTTTTFASSSDKPGPWKTYYQELAVYVSARKQIAQTFRAAVAAAKQEFDTASSAASTGAESATARAAYALAIAQAAQTRSAALVSLGNPPTAP
jgi:hypothetical protein